MLLIAGPPATGKSTVAGELGRRASLPIVATDLVRKSMLGVAPTDRLPDDAYGPETTRAVYREVGRCAARELTAHDGVIIDATARTHELREELITGLPDATPVV